MLENLCEMAKIDISCEFKFPMRSGCRRNIDAERNIPRTTFQPNPT